jgi:hypothetical protein
MARSLPRGGDDAEPAPPEVADDDPTRGPGLALTVEVRDADVILAPHPEPVAVARTSPLVVEDGADGDDRLVVVPEDVVHPGLPGG